MSTVPGEAKVATKQRLLEAAESLFADEGFDKISVRDITQRANANVAAVNYHFGSREGLVEAVIVRYISPVSEERLARLDALERRAGGKPVPLEELIEAMVRPFLTQIRRSELSEKLFFKLIGRLFGEQCKLPAAIESGFLAMMNRFQKAFLKTLPGVPGEEVWWRMHLMAGAMVHSLSHIDMLQRASSGAAGTPTMEQTISRFIRFGAAGMRQDFVGAGEVPEKKGPQVEFTF